VCDGAERSEFAKTLLMLGQAAGAVIFSPLADRFGRKPCNVIARILYFVTALATVFTPNIAAFSAFRFLQGTFQGLSSLSYSYSLHIAIIMKRKFEDPEHLRSSPVFSGVHATRSIVLYVCFVVRCLSFRTFSFGHCFVFDIRILITPLVSLNSS
jgi:hypothetical protein